MANFWFLAGGALLLWQRFHPEVRGLTIRGTGISFGWLALALALYDLVRWLLGRPRRRPPPRPQPRHPFVEPPDPNLAVTQQPPTQA
jgi:hypothetical protein